MISLICPTRLRHHKLEGFLSSYYNTCHRDDFHVWFYLIKDDYLSKIQVQKLTSKFNTSNIHTVVGDDILLTRKVNYLGHLAITYGSDIVHLCGDDIIMHTKNWDQIVIEEFNKIPDGIVYVHGRDEYMGDFGTHGFLHRNWLNVVGSVCPIDFSESWADAVINEIAINLDRKICVDINIEHMHHIVGKAEMDDTYLLSRQHAINDNNAQKFIESLPLRSELCQKLSKFITDYNNEPNKSIAYQRIYP